MNAYNQIAIISDAHPQKKESFTCEIYDAIQCVNIADVVYYKQRSVGKLLHTETIAIRICG